jgi:hypothetical protein
MGVSIMIDITLKREDLKRLAHTGLRVGNPLGPVRIEAYKVIHRQWKRCTR